MVVTGLKITGITVTQKSGLREALGIFCHRFMHDKRESENLGFGGIVVIPESKSLFLGPGWTWTGQGDGTWTRA